MEELTDDEVKSVATAANLDYSALSLITKRLLRIPLHLDLMVMAVEGLNAGGSDSETCGESEAFRSYTVLCG